MKTYDEKQFLDKVKTVAESLRLNEELYREFDYLDFLYNLYLFITKIEERKIKYSLHHIHSGSTIFSILLGYEKAKRITGEFDFEPYFIDEFDDEKVPTFTICVSSSRKEEVVSILSSIVNVDFEHSSYNVYFFGKNHKYHINVLLSPYIDRLDKLETLTGLDNDEIPEGDIDIINYILEQDNKCYYMPNLYGCFLGGVRYLYQMMEIVKPTNLLDLTKLECINRAEYKDFSVVIESLKSYGLEFTLYSKEQLKHLLINIYEIPYKEALLIIEDVSRGRDLSSSRKETLLSYEVPEYIVTQFDNIQYLPYSIFDFFKMRLVYLLAYYKKHYAEQFLTTLDTSFKGSYVGPFFYINDKLYGHTDKMTTFNPNIRFFDSGFSHFGYFASLPIKGDYGNYPRGRVIFDNYNKKFIVYIDKSLDKKKIRDSIITKYIIPEERVVFEYDEHYTHDIF